MNGGLEKEDILITSNTFKLMLLNRNNGIGKKYRVYYLELE